MCKRVKALAANPPRQARDPSASSPPRPSSPTPPPSMRHQRAPSTRQGYTVMELSPSPEEATPNHVRSIDKSRAADWIEGARMASPPLSPGFASRRLESHPSPPQVSSTVAARNLVPDKENS